MPSMLITFLSLLSDFEKQIYSKKAPKTNKIFEKNCKKFKLFAPVSTNAEIKGVECLTPTRF